MDSIKKKPTFAASVLSVRAHLEQPIHMFSLVWQLTLQLPEAKIAEFANSVDPDEVAHNEPPHLDLHCLPSSL